MRSLGDFASLRGPRKTLASLLQRIQVFDGIGDETLRWKLANLGAAQHALEQDVCTAAGWG